MLDIQNTKTTSSATESEIVIYGAITKPEGLKEAISKTHQEQYEIKSTEIRKGRIRVRKDTDEAGVETYTQTLKVQEGSKEFPVNKEYTYSIDREYFDAFKSIASSGMVKNRYVFPLKKVTVGDTEITDIVGMFFEVDVFLTETQDERSWCKIDFEYGKLLDKIKTMSLNVKDIKLTIAVSSLPLGILDSFTKETATTTQEAILDYLYKNIFTRNIK
jgi:hypothetical protein